MSRLLLSLFNLRATDAPAVAPALAFAFLGVGAMSLATIASDTLFVSAFDLGAISRFYVVTAAVRFASAGTYAALARRYDGPRFDAVLLLATGASMAVAGALAQRGSHVVLYAVCVALAVLPPLLPLMTFRAVASSLEARMARRLLPLVAAAATVGIVAVNAAVPLLARALGAPGLLYAGGLLAALAAALPWSLARGAAPETLSRVSVVESGREGGQAGLLGALVGAGRDLRALPIVGVVLAASLLGAAATNFVDYGLKVTLKARYARDQMAVFLGTFGALTNLIVLVLQLFGTSRFLARFGVRAALAAPFAALVAFGGWVGLAPGVAATAASRLAETTFRYALASPVSDLLLTPVPRRSSIRAKVLAKGVAGPLGAMLAGLVLASFGRHGPPLWALGALLAATGVFGLAATYGAKAAYTRALSRALGEGRIEHDLSAATARALKAELSRLLQAAIASGDSAGAVRTLALVDDALFSTLDLGLPLRAGDPAVRRAAIAAFLRTARPGVVKPDASGLVPLPIEGALLLELAPPDEDLGTERALFAAARSLGAVPPRARLEAALARARAAEGAEGADLWAEALIGLASTDAREAAMKDLRREALAPGSPRRAPALRALGDLRERRAQREVLLSLGSADGAVFAEAARTAVLIEAHGAVAALLSRLSTGSEVRAVTRALALAGPRAVDELIAALPTTRGQGAAVSTSIASGGTLPGSVRAARVLAQLGPEACARVLGRFAELGYRARNAVARSLSTVARRAGDPGVDPGLVRDAMELTLAYAESLVPVYPRAPEGLLRRELRHRIEETAARLLDLAAVIGDRELITRARAALPSRGHGAERARGHALELLENVLPRPFAARAVALLELDELDWGTPPPSSEGVPPSGPPRGRPLGALPALDGWLEKCRAFDANELASSHPMASVLEKVVVLVDSSLFTGLSGEELYPVAEIARFIDFAEGAVVVRQGDPGDALFVVASGTFEIVRGAAKLREVGPGAVFGEMSLLDGAPRAATVSAVTSGRLLRIPRAEFEALLDESPELARGVIRTLLGHLRSSSA